MNHCKQTVFLILLMLVLLLPLASAEGRTFITVDDCVPLEIRAGSAVTAEELIVPKWGNVINPQFGDQIHPSLTNGDTVVQGDISSLRVLLLLADADGNKYLQAAVWDADSATYAITRSSNLPENAYLDTYHEGDAIFLSVGYDTPGFAESGDLDDLAWLYMDGHGRVGRDRCDGRRFVLCGLRRRAVRCPGLLGRGRAANDFAGCNTGHIRLCEPVCGGNRVDEVR